VPYLPSKLLKLSFNRKKVFDPLIFPKKVLAPFFLPKAALGTGQNLWDKGAKTFLRKNISRAKTFFEKKGAETFSSKKGAGTFMQANFSQNPA
jgi:hypothetical protein